MKQAKITFLTSIGSALEHYDLVIYSLLASFISQKFFPGHNQTTALFATIGVYTLGSIIRPFGGVIFGIVGDRCGRKNVVANTMLLMAIITFFMGLIPTFATIGLAATILLSCCKILQGVILGAEVPGALTLMLEHINQKRHGFHFGFMTAAAGIGISFGTFIIWLLTKTLTESDMLAWGFRIPFLLGGSLALVGFYLRKHLPETPAFLVMQKTKTKLTLELIKKHFWQALNVVLVSLFPACFVVFFVFLPTYMHNIYGFVFSDIYLAMTCAYVWSSALIPVFGWISDYIGRKLLLIMASLVMIVFSFPIFTMLQTGSLLALFSFIFFGQTIIAAMSASYYVLIPQAFPASMRCTGAAFSYNIVYMIAALVLLLVNYIYGTLKQPVYIIWLFMLLAIITIVGTLVLKIKHTND